MTPADLILLILLCLAMWAVISVATAAAWAVLAWKRVR